MRELFLIIVLLTFSSRASGAENKPNIDQLAREGQRWTSFYAAAPLCTPSRKALMTGRLPIRIHDQDQKGWLPLPDSENTLGEMLKGQAYATGYIGKWWLTTANFDIKGSHPNEQGFDYFYGLVGSNDVPFREGFELTYDDIKNATSDAFPISLYRQGDVIETPAHQPTLTQRYPAHQPTLTQRYTEESVKCIQAQKDKPFLLFLAHTMPHVPIFASSAFKGKSKAGLYGGVVEELDWSVGKVMEALRKAGVADNTLVIFSSDNGPWRTYYDLGSSQGAFRDGKLTAWEGGFRVPGIFWWPGKIKPSVIHDMGVNVDFMSTIASLTGASLPSDRTYDSIDLSPTLLNDKASPRKEWFFYGAPGNLWAARVGNYKLVYES